MPEYWLILRTSGRHTLGLCTRLADVGIDAWSPAELLRRRVPRKRKFEEVRIPILPTFAFARAMHLEPLLELSQAAAGTLPDFSIFRWNGVFPTIRECELANLRLLEERAGAKPLAPTPQFRPGEAVRMSRGAFAGLAGIVVADNGRTALVDFGRGMAVKISTLTLRQTAVENATQAYGKAA